MVHPLWLGWLLRRWLMLKRLLLGQLLLRRHTLVRLEDRTLTTGILKPARSWPLHAGSRLLLVARSLWRAAAESRLMHGRGARCSGGVGSNNWTGLCQGRISRWSHGQRRRDHRTTGDRLVRSHGRGSISMFAPTRCATHDSRRQRLLSRGRRRIVATLGHNRWSRRWTHRLAHQPLLVGGIGTRPPLSLPIAYFTVVEVPYLKSFISLISNSQRINITYHDTSLGGHMRGDGLPIRAEMIEHLGKIGRLRHRPVA